MQRESFERDFPGLSLLADFFYFSAFFSSPPSSFCSAFLLFSLLFPARLDPKQRERERREEREERERREERVRYFPQHYNNLLIT